MAEEPRGWFHDDVVLAYLSEDLKKEYFRSSDVPYFRTEPANLHPIKVCDEKNVCYSPQSIGQCLCMDIGCWTGNGPKSPTNHQIHREFGVVCGSVAVLCAFPGNEFRPVGRLLRFLDRHEVRREEYHQQQSRQIRNGKKAPNLRHGSYAPTVAQKNQYTPGD